MAIAVGTKVKIKRSAMDTHTLHKFGGQTYTVVGAFRPEGNPEDWVRLSGKGGIWPARMVVSVSL